MTNAEIEKLIQSYREEQRERKNRVLRARLARPCTREELLIRLGALASVRAEEDKQQILLTKSSSPLIMEEAR